MRLKKSLRPKYAITSKTLGSVQPIQMPSGNQFYLDNRYTCKALSDVVVFNRLSKEILNNFGRIEESLKD